MEFKIPPNAIFVAEQLKNYLKNHMKLVHGNIKLFKCDSCDRPFLALNSLKRHNHTVHEGHRNENKCDSCDQLFSSSSKLKMHFEAIHEGKKHKCDLCGVYIFTLQGLKKHIKQFMKTKRTTSFNRHVRKNHSNK